MPHAVDEHELQSKADDDDIRRLLDPENHEPLLSLAGGDLDAGEKADDAEDYEDIELTDDEEDGVAVTQDEFAAINGNTTFDGRAPEHFEDDPDDMDDLFGDEAGQSAIPDTSTHAVSTAQPAVVGGLALPTKGRIALPGSMVSKPTTLDAEQYGSPTSLIHSDEIDARLHSQSDVDMDDEEDEDLEVRQQRHLFEQMKAEREERARRGASYEPPQAAETDLETFFNIWPTYDPEERPRFMELFPQRRALFIGKAPNKPPKPIQPTKLNLELQTDQEKSFRLPGNTAPNRDSWQEHQGTILVGDSYNEQDESDDGIDFDQLNENEVIGGVSWQDLTLVCEDWDVYTEGSQGDSGIDVSEEHNNASDTAASKKRKRRHSFDLKEAIAFSHFYPPLDDPERATAKVARKVQLDMNDPGLLLDENVPISQPRKLRCLAVTLVAKLRALLLVT